MLYLLEHEIRVTHAHRQAGYSYSMLASGTEDMNLAVVVIDKN